MKNLNYLLIALFFITLFSCKKEKKLLKLIKVSEYSSAKISDSALIKLFRDKQDIELDISYSLSEDFALDQLKEKKIDLVILPNNAKSKDFEFNTIVPLLPRILMILTNKNTDYKDVKDIFEKGTVYFEDRSRLDSLIFKKLYYNFNINESKIQSKLSEEIVFDNESDSLEVYVGLTHLNNELIRKLIDKGWDLFSVDDIEFYGKGSRIEGFTMLNTSAYPFVIPMSIYKGRPKKSILTIAIKDVLITRSDMENDLVYDITKTLIENRSHLIQMNNAYNLLDFDFDNQVLSFPLHEGARNFLERNKPSIWMKYVNMAWPILSILVIFLGAITSFRSNLKKKRKENIENYYTSLLSIREKSELVDEVEEINKLLTEIRSLRTRAIESIAKNKLDSGESFNIFLALYTEIKNDLIESLDNLKKKTV